MNINQQEINKNYRLTGEQLKYINENVRIEVLNDDNGAYAKLSLPTFQNNNKYNVEVSFYINSLEIISKNYDEYPKYNGSFNFNYPIITHVSFPLKFI